MAFYQSYLMGCAFNMYSQAWSDRSYGVTLFLYCFVLPLPVILSSYLGIIYLARSSGDQFEGKTDGDKNPSNENDNEDIKLEQPEIERTPSHSRSSPSPPPPGPSSSPLLSQSLHGDVRCSRPRFVYVKEKSTSTYLFVYADVKAFFMST